MKQRFSTLLPLAAAAALVGASFAQAQAQDLPRRTAAAARPATHLAGGAVAYRPLTIGKGRWTVTTGLHAGILMRHGEIYAPGGFSAHHYGQRFASYAAARKAARNDELRDSADVYLEGYPGLSGLGVGRDSGYENPSYGNAFNRYTGYNGVPSELAFGPTYGFRHAIAHDPLDDDDEAPPSPTQLGYGPAAASDADE